MRGASSDDAFRQATAFGAVMWAVLCVVLCAISFLSLAARPSHRFFSTVLLGNYVVVGPDGVAAAAGVRRGDHLLEVNEFALSERPLGRVPLRTDSLNTYLFERAGDTVYRVRLPHREPSLGELFQIPATYALLVLLLLPGVYLGLGIAVYRARPDLRSSWALLLLASFVAAYLPGVLYPGWRLPGTELALGLNAAMMLVPGLHLVTMYPQELEAISRRRKLLVLPYLVGFGLFTIYAVAYAMGRGYERAVHLLLYGNLTVAPSIGIYMLIARRQMPSRDLRDRADIALLGFAVSAVPVGIVFMVHDVLEATLPILLAFAWFVMFPLVVGIGILRQEVIGIRDVAKSSFVYGLLTVGITATYALAVALTGTLYGSYQLENPWVSFPVIFGLVLLFNPMRERLHAFADRLFERDPAHYQETFRTVSEALVSLLSVDEIVDRVLWALTGPMGAACATVLLFDREQGTYRLAAWRGCRLHPGWQIRADHPLVKLTWSQRVGLSEEELPGLALPEALEACRMVYGDLGIQLLVPLSFGVDLRGLIGVGRKRTGDPLLREDRETVRTLANQAAVAIENALAYEEIQRLNRTLETRIEERTRELRETQAALAHREKMASIGQLVAGVAHEINNPIAFVHSNLQLIGEQIDRLIGGLEVDKRAATLDARLNLEKLLERGREGTRRIRDIVQALRTFSRVDQEGLEKADLSEGIDMTLELMSPRLRDVEVVQEYGWSVPVRCHAGQINQVVMNLLLNACDAGATRIVVRTGAADGWAWVEVEDNGSGIASEHRSRIFEPFFTTKGVGEGTGLGLAISHGIVERHGGRIRLFDVGEHGTRFRIELPVSGPDGEARG
jgi:signal transduction histidine kinase